MRYDEDYPEIIENCIRSRENLEHFYDYPIEVYQISTLRRESIANNSNSDYFFSEDREINEINLLYILIGNNSIIIREDEEAFFQLYNIEDREIFRGYNSFVSERDRRLENGQQEQEILPASTQISF